MVLSSCLLNQINVFLNFESFWRQCCRVSFRVVFFVPSVMYQDRNSLYLGNLEATGQQEETAWFLRYQSSHEQIYLYWGPSAVLATHCEMHSPGLTLPLLLSCCPFLQGYRQTPGYPTVYRSCLGKPAAQDLWVLRVQQKLEAPLGDWNHWSHGTVLSYSFFHRNRKSLVMGGSLLRQPWMSFQFLTENTKFSLTVTGTRIIYKIYL